MELNYDEELLIRAIRDIKMTPVPVLIGFRNGFYNDNKNKQWDSVIETLDDYIEKMIRE